MLYYTTPFPWTNSDTASVIYWRPSLLCKTTKVLRKVVFAHTSNHSSPLLCIIPHHRKTRIDNDVMFLRLLILFFPLEISSAWVNSFHYCEEINLPSPLEILAILCLTIYLGLFLPPAVIMSCICCQYFTTQNIVHVSLFNWYVSLIELF